MMGSHLDSQSRAGRLDGTYGVAAALRVGAGLMTARRAGAPFTADFCAVNWTNEEGARFRPSLLGSGTYLGRHTVAEALACRDDDGISLGTALAEIGAAGGAVPPPRPACYLEIHVEQGTVLEEAGRTIGIVTRNWGATKIEAVFTGVQAHTGPGRMERRRDALLAAAYAIADVRALAEAWPGRLYTAVGRVQVAPNSANVVAARVEISVELRSADDAILAEAGERADRLLREAADRAGTGLTIAGRSERPIRELPEAVCRLVAACAEARGLGTLRMDTVAGHDALSFLGICPTGLVFVPSVDGIAHNEAEATDPADLAAGLALMREAAERLCRHGGDPVRAARSEPTG
jgi:N-carbamoyl-L-amino-acid hydrolase